jgi:hypothetical protein
MRRILPALLLAACGHTYSASLGVSRRADGVHGVQATIGATLHLISGTVAKHVVLYEPIGLRVGGGVDGDGAGRLIVEMVTGLGILPPHRGLAASALYRGGTGIGASLMIGGAWRRWSERAEMMVLPDAPIDYTKIHFAELGLEAGYEHGGRAEANAVVGFGFSDAADDDQ